MTSDRDRAAASSERPLRVCFVSHQYPPRVVGGIGRFTADLAEGFAAAGHDVHVLSSQGGLPPVSRENGVWVHRLPSPPIIPEPIKNEPAGLFLARIGLVYRELMRAHQQQPFDAISSPIFLAEGLLAAMDPRLTSILSLHTTSQTGRALDRPGQMADPLTVLEARSVSAHSHTHANSHAAVARIIAEYSAPKGVVVLPHGVRDESRRFARKRRRDGRIRVLLVGLLDKRKGADVLFDIIPGILSRFPMIEFVLAGPAYPMVELQHQTLPLAMKRKLAAKPDTLQRVRFLGVVNDSELYQHYADADMLLLPSRYESFGLSVIEAMSFGLPVVAWKAGGVCETVIDGVTGILVEVEDRKGLVEAIGRLALDSGLRRRFGASARQRYLSRFSTAVSVPRTIAAYRNIVETSATSLQASRSFHREALVSQFAAVIESVTALQGEPALRTAGLLIGGDDSDQPIELEPPLVVVIVLCRNHARHVVAALDSVLEQTYRNFDCVVVDDASSDGTAYAISRWASSKRDDRFKLVRNEASRGQMASIAAALAACAGRLVAILDADKFWLPDFLELHVGVLHGTSAAMSCSDLVQVDEHGRMLSGTLFGYRSSDGSASEGCILLDQDDLAWSVPRSARSLGVTFMPAIYPEHPQVVASAMMFRRSVIEAVIPSNLDDLRTGAGAYIFVLCHCIAGSLVIPRPLAAYRHCGKSDLSMLVAPGRPVIDSSRFEPSSDTVVLQAMLQHLLDAPSKLTSVLPLPRRRYLVRTLLRRCLRAGIAVKDPRVRDMLGWQRLLRDRLRAKTWRLRGRALQR